MRKPTRAIMLLWVWLALGAGLLAVAVIAWSEPTQVQAWLAAWQRAYGTVGRPHAALRVDAHLHVIVTFLVVLWWGLGCRLFVPASLPWLPVALTVLVALADEFAQIGSATRSFEISDQVADFCGLCAGFPLLLLLARLRLVPERPQDGPPGSEPPRTAV